MRDVKIQCGIGFDIGHLEGSLSEEEVLRVSRSATGNGPRDILRDKISVGLICSGLAEKIFPSRLPVAMCL